MVRWAGNGSSRSGWTGPTLVGMRTRATAGRPTDGRRDEDDHVRGGRIIEHYRLDPTKQLLRALGLGSLIMALGALTGAGALFYRRPQPSSTHDEGVFRIGLATADGRPIQSGSVWWELGLGLIGLGSIVTGGTVAIVGLHRILREERYLALRTDGAFFRAGREHSLVRWEDVSSVRWDNDRQEVVFDLHDEDDPWRRPERYAGIAGPELAKRASEVRRKALFSLLK